MSEKIETIDLTPSFEMTLWQLFYLGKHNVPASQVGPIIKDLDEKYHRILDLIEDYEDYRRKHD